ncbi:Phophatidylserine decarboxylase-domain-containing protein [Lanmaoa asiatica]|nr:Phophatidylserine decarboxylase-domain-containing protein [Lanmaoa asiatica]
MTLPKDPSVIRKCQSDLLAQLVKKGVCIQAGDVDEGQLSLVILEFEKLIEEDPEIFRGFHEMLDQVPPILDPNQLTYHYGGANLQLHQPSYKGVPMYGVFAPFCNTRSGYHAFTNPKVNAIFHKIFDRWTRFPISPASRDVLVSTEGGWLSPDALQIQGDRLVMPFTQAWACYPDWPHMGFKSWDDFFEKHNPQFINTACEAITYQVATDVQATDEFWLKEMAYSLEHILNHDPLASQFVGGTVFQAMLSSLDYHRWHSPVDGRVVRTYVMSSPRALIFIESDNPHIGLMCFVGVGLGEISTTKVGAREGDRIKKGDELGSFHFGGSTYLLVFHPETKLTLLPGPENLDEARQVGTLLFYVDHDSATV